MTMISELLDEHRKRKFGIVDDDFSTEYTDPTDPVHTSSGLDFNIQQESFEVFDRNLSEVCSAIQPFICCLFCLLKFMEDLH